MKIYMNSNIAVATLDIATSFIGKYLKAAMPNKPNTVHKWLAKDGQDEATGEEVAKCKKSLSAF